jgi:hypothetical protein
MGDGRVRDFWRGYSLARMGGGAADSMAVGWPVGEWMTLFARGAGESPPAAAVAMDFRASRSTSTVRRHAHLSDLPCYARRGRFFAGWSDKRGCEGRLRSSVKLESPLHLPLEAAEYHSDASRQGSSISHQASRQFSNRQRANIFEPMRPVGTNNSTDLTPILQN